MKEPRIIFFSVHSMETHIRAPSPFASGIRVASFQVHAADADPRQALPLFWGKHSGSPAGPGLYMGVSIKWGFYFGLPKY